MKRSEERTRKAKNRIFAEIEKLLETYDLDGITFGRIAKRLGCQPNAVVYYFNSKMDMLQQFIQDYMVTADTELLPILRSGIEALPPVERFCREIDCIFAVSKRKSRPRLITNHLLITSASFYESFSADLDHKMRQDWENVRQRLDAYREFGILAEERFDDSYLELIFFECAFSLVDIFGIPIQPAEVQLHNTKERLKAAFLKDGLYAPQYRTAEDSAYILHDDMEGAARRYRISEEQIPALKLEVFRHITRLMEEDRLEDITFANLAELCYCQPSGIAYYFENKQDMMLQAIVWRVEQYHPAEPRPDRDSGSNSLTDFCRFVHQHSTASPRQTQNWDFWINYYLLTNINRYPAYLDYFCFFQQRTHDTLLNNVRRFEHTDYLRPGSILPWLFELINFQKFMAIQLIFRNPIPDRQRISRITAERLLRNALRPEYHDAALQILNELG